MRYVRTSSRFLPNPLHSTDTPTPRIGDTSLARFTGLLGLLVFLGLAYAFSTNRRAIRWKTVAWGLGLQILFAFAVIKWSFGQTILKSVSDFITGLLAQ